MHKVMVKPLSTNQAWAGRRFKSEAYKAFEQEMLLRLPRGVEIPAGDLCLYLEAGQSNMRSDVDNVCKQTIDCLAKKYGFDDCRIVEMSVRKKKVEKGAEYILFNIVSAD